MIFKKLFTCFLIYVCKHLKYKSRKEINDDDNVDDDGSDDGS